MYLSRTWERQVYMHVLKLLKTSFFNGIDDKTKWYKFWRNIAPRAYVTCFIDQLIYSTNNIDILYIFSNDFITLFAINTDHRFL